MINLFNIENYNIDTSKFNHILHDSIVTEFEQKIADYVGAKYACGVSSATNAIFLALNGEFDGQANKYVTIPTMIPPVVANAIITSGNRIMFKDDVNWVGDSYILHEYDKGEKYKVIDSAQKLEKDQFKKEANDEDLMIFSFYPTKPIGSIDGGMVVSNDKKKIEWFRQATLNGMSFAKNNWERKINFPGYKMYMNSIQAYVANENFKKYENKLSALREIKNIYNFWFELKNTSNHLYRIEVEDNVSAMDKLKNAGITTGIHYSCLHDKEAYPSPIAKFPESAELAKHTLSIPFHEAMTVGDINKVIKEVRNL
jgi:dTDP-4-amino-4,6-dideoxygalactose transaminase